MAPHPIRIRTRAEKNQLDHADQSRCRKVGHVCHPQLHILVVAAFNVMASLTMLLLDKREDMAVLACDGPQWLAT